MPKTHSLFDQVRLSALREAWRVSRACWSCSAALLGSGELVVWGDGEPPAVIDSLRDGGRRIVGVAAGAEQLLALFKRARGPEHTEDTEDTDQSVCACAALASLPHRPHHPCQPLHLPPCPWRSRVLPLRSGRRSCGDLGRPWVLRDALARARTPPRRPTEYELFMTTSAGTLWRRKNSHR